MINLEFVSRVCPLCASNDNEVFIESTLDEERLSESAFASRKIPEYMHCRMVECKSCGMLYTNPALRQETLANAYKHASFDSRDESHLAALTYRALLEMHLPGLPDRKNVLDIGAGDGAFLEQLLSLGFENVIGVEPSEAPIEAAKVFLRRHLRKGIFEANQFESASFDLITCFQVMEHVWDPVAISKDALALLKPGGMFFIVVHNRRAVSARVLGTKSPIFDIEHLQLFDKRTSAALMKNAGFQSVTVNSVRNKYPLDYWIKLFPLPVAVKSAVRSMTDATRIGMLRLSLPAGNLALTGLKPSDQP